MPPQFIWALGGGLVVYLWLKGQFGGTGAIRNQPPTPALPLYRPCVIDPNTGDCVYQEVPLPGTPVPGVPTVAPGLTPGPWPVFVPQIVQPTSTVQPAVVSGAPGTETGALLVGA